MVQKSWLKKTKNIFWAACRSRKKALAASQKHRVNNVNIVKTVVVVADVAAVAAVDGDVCAEVLIAVI